MRATAPEAIAADCGRPAAAHEPLVQHRSVGDVSVDVRVRHPEALDVGTRSDEVGRSARSRSSRAAEKSGTVSSASVAVPIESDAPTAMIRLSKAGFARAGEDPLPWYPLLPAAATTTMPASQACSTAYASGSTLYHCVEFVP